MGAGRGAVATPHPHQTGAAHHTHRNILYCKHASQDCVMHKNKLVHIIIYTAANEFLKPYRVRAIRLTDNGSRETMTGPLLVPCADGTLA